MTQWKADRDKVGELNCIIVSPCEKKVNCLFAMCHGFGAPGDDLVGLIDYWLPRFERSGIYPLTLFPEAPIDLADEGMPGGRAWWRINMAQLMQMAMTHSFDAIRNEVPPGIDEARQKLESTIEGTIQKFRVEDVPIIVGGFSQGAMLAVEFALMSRLPPPRGLVVLSGALISESRWLAHEERLYDVQAFQSHGLTDNILPIETGRALAQMLKSRCRSHRWLEGSGPHYVPIEANEPICDLIRSIVSESSGQRSH